MNFLVQAAYDALPVDDDGDLHRCTAEVAALDVTAAVLRALTEPYPPDSNMPMSVLRALGDDIAAEADDWRVNPDAH